MDLGPVGAQARGSTRAGPAASQLRDRELGGHHRFQQLVSEPVPEVKKAKPNKKNLERHVWRGHPDV